MGPGYSHEFSDQVPGDELDGLWLVLQGQSREGFLNGTLISEQHDGAVALGQGLWVQKDSLEAGHLTSCWSVLNFKCGPPLSWGFHPIQWQGQPAGPRPQAHESSQGVEEVGGALHLNMARCALY